MANKTEWLSYLQELLPLWLASTLYPGLLAPLITVLKSDRSQVSDFYPDMKDTWAIIKAFATLLTAVSKVFPTEGLISSTKYWYQFLQGEFGLFAGISGMLDDVLIKNPVNQHDKVNHHHSASHSYLLFPPSSSFNSVGFIWWLYQPPTQPPLGECTSWIVDLFFLHAIQKSRYGSDDRSQSFTIYYWIWNQYRGWNLSSAERWKILDESFRHQRQFAW